MCQYVPMCQYVLIYANMCQYVLICANMCWYVPTCVDIGWYMELSMHNLKFWVLFQFGNIKAHSVLQYKKLILMIVWKVLATHHTIQSVSNFIQSASNFIQSVSNIE